MNTPPRFCVSGELPGGVKSTMQLNVTLEFFRSMTEKSFLDRLRRAVAVLSERKSQGDFAEVAAALDSLGSNLRSGQRDIRGFLTGLSSAPGGVCQHPDDTDISMAIRLADEDIDFLIHVERTLSRVVRLIEECAAVCRKDVLSIPEVSQVVSRAASVLQTQTAEYSHAKIFMQRLISTMQTQCCQTGERTTIVQ